jgi:hypothetical protein
MDFDMSVAGMTQLTYHIVKADGNLHVLADNASQNGQPEAMLVDGVVYAHGPLSIPEAGNAIWYTLGTPEQAQALPLNTAAHNLSMLTRDVDLHSLVLDRAETLDGRRCSVYRGRQNALLHALNGAGVWTKVGRAPSIEEQLKGVIVTDPIYEISVCDDGYLHQILVHTRMQRNSAAAALEWTTKLHISEFGTAQIAAPATSQSVFVKDGGASLLPLLPIGHIRHAGNVRAAANLEGPVLDQVQADETVYIIQKTSDSSWFLARTDRAVTGWIHTSLLDVHPALNSRIAIAQP